MSAKKMESVFVNKFVKKNSGRVSMHTYFEDQPHAGFWECDAYDLKSGDARNEDWLTMDENLKKCHEQFKGMTKEELLSHPAYKVKVEFEKNDDDSFKSAKAIEWGF